jgi:hypothetical protein
MIKEEYIVVIGHPRNKKYYTDLGYDIEVGKPSLIKPKHLSKGCVSKVTTVCENCGRESLNTFKDYWNYTNGFMDNYYCNSCKSIKSEKTSLENWGFKNPMQNDEIKARLSNSLLDKYGVSHYSKTDEWLSKFRKTSLENWGQDNPSKNIEIIKIIRDKNIEMLTSSDFRNDSKSKKQRNTWKKYAGVLPNDYNVIKYENDSFSIRHNKCDDCFDITKGLLYTRLKNKSIICINCNPVTIMRSSFELEVGEFISSLGIKVEIGNREILEGLELDYFLPELNLAIECNGLYWHGELFKSRKYHQNKTNLCKDKSINLIHIWEDDWNKKSNIIKSIISNRVGMITNKIWARKCEIRLVSTTEYKKFLIDNHIQGYASSSYKIGLYHKNELVSLMTFGWRRTNNKREFELIRFCNKLNYLVVGSASKLFNFFLNSNDVDEIVSYADISLFNGSLYNKLGFQWSGLSEPNYFWVVDGVRRHRYNFCKRKLVKEGFDSNKTEVEIMNDRGYWRIFSTGQEKWIYFRKIFLIYI